MVLIKTYQKLIIKSYIGPFVLTFFIALFVLLMQFLWKYIDDLVGKGLEPGIIAELLLYASFSLVPLALPLAILLSSLMTFGNLGEHYELVAFKAAGVSLQRVMQPLIVVSAMICVGAFFFSNYALPYANLKMKSLLYDVSKSKPTLNIKEGVYNSEITGYSIRVNKKTDDGKTLNDIVVYDHTAENGNTSVTVAKKGTMGLTPDKTKMVLTLYDGNSYNEVRSKTKKDGSNDFYKVNRADDPYMRESFKKLVFVMSMEDFGLKRTDESLFKDNAQMMNLTQLEQTKDTLESELKRGIEHTARNVQRGYRYFQIYIERQGPEITPVKITAKKNLLDGIPPNESRRILETAANIARSSKALIENSVNDTAMVQKNIARHEVEWHRKFTLSFACLVLFFVAAPLGAIIRKGGLGLPMVVSVCLFITFHIISITGEKFAKGGVLSAFQGMWLAPSVLLPLGIYLTYKATTDSALFDSERYMRIFRKILPTKTWNRMMGEEEKNNKQA